MKPIGYVDVQVRYRDVFEKLQIVIMPGCGPPLMGRQWIHVLQIPIVESWIQEKKSAHFF